MPFLMMISESKYFFIHLLAIFVSSFENFVSLTYSIYRLACLTWFDLKNFITSFYLCAHVCTCVGIHTQMWSCTDVHRYRCTCGHVCIYAHHSMCHRTICVSRLFPSMWVQVFELWSPGLAADACPWFVSFNSLFIRGMNTLPCI